MVQKQSSVQCLLHRCHDPEEHQRMALHRPEALASMCIQQCWRGFLTHDPLCTSMGSQSLHLVAVQDMYKSRSYLDDNDSTRGRRMEAVSYLSSLLQKTGDLMDAAGGEQRQLYRQVCKKTGCPENQGPCSSDSVSRSTITISYASLGVHSTTRACAVRVSWCLSCRTVACKQ